MSDAALLSIDNLTKRYPGVTALDDLTVELPRGCIGFVGANGAGKTTTFRILLGLARPTKGRVQICGVDVARDPISVRARLGYMPEHDCLPLDQTAADVGELRAIAAILGHSPEMLLNTYAHALPQSTSAIVDRIGRRSSTSA